MSGPVVCRDLFLQFRVFVAFPLLTSGEKNPLLPITATNQIESQTTNHLNHTWT